MSGRRNGFSNPDAELDNFAANTATAATEDEALTGLIDFTEVDERKAGQFPLLAKGDYNGTVRKCEYGISKGGAGNPMWTWQIEVIDPETSRKHNLRYWTVLTKSRIADVKADIMRVAPELNLQGLDLKEAPVEFEGRPVRVRVTQKPDTREAFKGQMQNSITKFLALEDNADSLSDFLS